MTDYQVTAEGRRIEPAEGWGVEWLGDHVARLSDGERSLLAAVDGGPTDWVITLHGRRIPISVRSWRERMLAEAEVVSPASTGPVDVKATLPGLVVAVLVAPGQQVKEGDRLMTIEAMKMQNEVRAPLTGRVAEVAVQEGRTVASGALLVRLEPRPQPGRQGAWVQSTPDERARPG